MENFREKYGQWGVVLGATEGMGKAISEDIAARGMNVVLVGRREEKLKELGAEITAKYNVETKVVRADFATDDALETVTAVTDGLDMGFMSYVACLHKFGRIQDMSWEDHEKMLKVNVITFMKFMLHYTKRFSEQKRGCIMNITSLTAVTSQPFNSQYAAGKSYILKMTEGVARECEANNVDVLVVTCGSIVTPTWLKNQPGGAEGEEARRLAQLPEEVSAEAFAQIGKCHSYVAGPANQQAVEYFKTLTADQQAAMMGGYFEDKA